MKRTVMASVITWRDHDGLERRTRFGRTYLNPGNLAPREYAESRRARGDVVGAPEEVVEQIRAYAEPRVQEIMVDVLDLEDLELLELIADEVISRV